MNGADCCQHCTLTLGSLYTCIGAVLKLVNKPDTKIVFGVAVAITDMNTTPDAKVMDFLLNKPPVLFPLPPTQPDLPQEIVLHQTGTPEDNLRIRLGNRTQSQYLTEKLVRYPFRCIRLAPRLFSQNILGTQVLKAQSPLYSDGNYQIQNKQTNPHQVFLQPHPRNLLVSKTRHVRRGLSLHRH